MEEYDGITAFLRVVELGSFTAAAKALRRPKTTVSRQVRRLEDDLSATLLNRTTRRVSVTEAGQAFYDAARGIPATIEDAFRRVAELQGEPAGTLRVTAPFSLLHTVICPLLPEFQILYPRVRLDLIATHQTLDLVGEGIDLALRLGPLPDSSMVARRIATLCNRVWAAPKYLARHGSPAHPEDLAECPTLVTRVARRPGGHAWEMKKNGFNPTDYPVSPILEADDPVLLMPSLLSGAGLTMATDLVVEDHVRAGRIVAVLAGWTGRSPELHAVFPGGGIIPEKLRAFIDFLAMRLDTIVDDATVLHRGPLD